MSICERCIAQLLGKETVPGRVSGFGGERPLILWPLGKLFLCRSYHQGSSADLPSAVAALRWLSWTIYGFCRSYDEFAFQRQMSLREETWVRNPFLHWRSPPSEEHSSIFLHSSNAKSNCAHAEIIRGMSLATKVLATPYFSHAKCLKKIEGDVQCRCSVPMEEKGYIGQVFQLKKLAYSLSAMSHMLHAPNPRTPCF